MTRLKLQVPMNGFIFFEKKKTVVELFWLPLNVLGSFWMNMSRQINVIMCDQKKNFLKR